MCKSVLAGGSRLVSRALLGLAVATLPALLFAQVPGQVTGLIWCPGTKDCLAWSAANGATEYRLYRGSLGSLPDLLNPNADSCKVATYTATTTQGGLSDTPTRCGIFWYLVTGANGTGEGAAGDATGGPRVLNAPAGQCQAACTAEGNLCTASGACCSGDCQGGCVPACSDPDPCGFYMSKCSGACTNTATDPANCGGCGVACPSHPNSVASCTNAACGTSCNAGFLDCNANATDGCEVSVNTDPNNCGGCGASCSFTNMQTRTCGGGTCNGTCFFFAADCNGNKRTDGCEVNTNGDLNNCGDCGASCSGNHMLTRTCGGGQCVGLCASGFADCNGNKRTDGCETNIASNVNNCGACGNVCPSRPNAVASCTSGACGFVCNTGFLDCNANATDGCEVNINTDANNCNGCGLACPSRANAAASCASGACGFVCNTGFLDCNANATDGCEVNISTDLNNCGACGTVCPSRPNSVASCSNSQCGIVCNTGFLDCNANAADGCEVDITTDPNNCGGCGTACPSRPNSSRSCSNGVCGFTCTSPFRDCDGNPANGCEINTNSDTNNCASCGNVCAFPNAAAACSSAKCIIQFCNAGFGNCNGSVPDGCEINLTNNPNNCGTCGHVCPAGTPTCMAGTCH